MKRVLLAVVISFFAMGQCLTMAQSDVYVMPDVKVSTDKVKIDGKVFYSHVVLPKQTLFSISKAYGVSVQDIYDANPILNLETQGVKANQILLIPSVKKQNQTAQIPSAPETPNETPSALTPEMIQELLATKSDEVRDSVSVTFVPDIPEEINLTLLLPLSGRNLASGNEIEFLSGALLAARDLGADGTKMRVKTIDISQNEMAAGMLDNSDVTIGPINSRDIQKVIPFLPAGKFLVSPLDPRVADLTQDFPIIQAPAPSGMQVAEIMNWINEDWNEGDVLIVVRESGNSLTGGAKEILDAVSKCGKAYSTISYGILEGLKMGDVFESKASASGTTRFVIASENESFVSDAVRNIDLLLYKKHQVALYSTARIRSFSTLEIENLHEASLKMAATYNTDYDDSRVKSFILAFRALFHTEPGSFAFQGYDTVHYFASMCKQYGRGWAEKIYEHSEKGLQTSFSFSKDDSDSRGSVNTAVRRIEYKPDYSVIIY